MPEQQLVDPEGNVLDQLGDVVTCHVKDDDDWVEVEAEIVGFTKKGLLVLQFACLACGLRRRIKRKPDAVHLARRAG